MKRSHVSLQSAFSAVKRGEYEKAFELADSIIRKDINNFWAWYIAAVALGFLQKVKTFEHYVERAESLNRDSAFLLYLVAYISLTRNDLEGALLTWTRIVDSKEGSLAKDLIEKARKGANLVERAQKGDLGSFILIPDFSIRMESEVQQTESSEIPQPEHSNFRAQSFLKILLKNLVIIILAGGVFFVLKDPVQIFLSNSSESTDEMWKNFRIDEWAALVKPLKSEKNIYKYKSKDDLIEDFDRAKLALSEKKINQARFYLQRIIHSNADFKTKEKSKIFLSFIPEPDYQDFSDPLFPDKILENPDYYADCIVLWQGSVIKMRDVERGKEIRMLVRDDKSEYIVDAFLPTMEKKGNWQPFSDYRQNKALADKKSQAIVYGRYKGLLGKQKIIYLELIQLWM